MHIAIAVDDRMGMMFNGRRLSRDEELCRYLATMSRPGRICVGSRGRELFEAGPRVYAGDDYLTQAGPDDICFIEDPDDLSGVPFDAVWVCRWNRRYPSDRKLPDGFLDGLLHVASADIKGSSHEKITIDAYGRAPED